MSSTEQVAWADLRKCPVCHAETGNACRSLSGMIVGGRPDGTAVDLDWPHVNRKARSARRHGRRPELR